MKPPADNLWVFAIRYFEKDADLVEMKDLVTRAKRAGYTGLALVSGGKATGDWWDYRPKATGIEAWWKMPPDRQARLKALAAFCREQDFDLIPVIWSVGYNSMWWADPSLSAVTLVNDGPEEEVPYPVGTFGGVVEGAAHTVFKSARIKVEPHRKYRVTGLFRTENLWFADPLHGGFGCGVRCCAFAADGETNLDFIAPKGPMTRDWTPFSFDFPSGENSEAVIALGKWWEEHDPYGKCEFKDVKITSLHAPGGYEQKLFANTQSSACLSNPALYDFFRKSAAAIWENFAPRKWFLSMDEIRVMCECPRCRADNDRVKHLKNTFRAEVEAIRAVCPDAEIYCWSDMLDPGHNAWAEDIIDALPKDAVIAMWHGGRKAESVQFFTQKGHPVLAAGFYDVPTAEEARRSAREWKAAMALPGVRSAGLMYTTWAGLESCTEGDYLFLEDFAKAWY